MCGKMALLLLIIVGLVCIAEPVYSIGLGSYGPCECQARNAAGVYCIQHGGCVRDGNCYFPDGSYCDLWSFFNGTCPGKAYYEQMMWEQEAYNFLYGDSGYYLPNYYQPNAYPPYYTNSPYYTNYNWPKSGPYLSDPLSPTGW